MIVDAFLFWPGKEMELQCRLFELYGVVDRHIAFCAEEMDPDDLHKYRRDGMPLDSFGSTPDVLKGVISEFGPNAGFIMGEVTAIPKRWVVDDFDFKKPSVCKMDKLVYSTKYVAPRRIFGSVMGATKHFNKGFVKSLEQRRTYEAIDDAGWLLEWFGGEVSLQEQLENHPVEQVRMARKDIAEQAPRKHMGPDGEMLSPYRGETPDWHKRNHAPNSWDLEW